jgi:Kef-type K+ transport system membrane component KefB
MQGVMLFGAVVTLRAVASKVIGAAVPAMATGFNLRGSARIGVGMLPRGEVALIIAGVGLARGVIDADLFGVSIMMTVVTTLASPVLLVPLFRGGGSGRRASPVTEGTAPSGS